MVEEAVGRVAHRADHGELVVHFGHLGQDLGKVHAGDFGRNRLERAAHVIGHVFLGVPEIEMAGSALEINHDDIFGLTPTGTAAGFGGFASHGL